MGIRTVLVNLDIDGPIEPRVRLATDLAVRFGARLTGFCAVDAPFPVVPPGAGIVVAKVWQQLRDDVEAQLRQVQARFEALVPGSVAVDWRSAVADPTRTLTHAARCADVVVTGAPTGASRGDPTRTVDPGDLILQAGRPVLVAAAGADALPMKAAVVAWKDSREARRAIADAVPLLASAAEVTVACVDRNPDAVRDGVGDVVAFLAHHGIRARPEVVGASTDETAALFDVLAKCGADLVVSGAYGHSRFREWAFGGVTRSLLEETRFNRLMSA